MKKLLILFVLMSSTSFSQGGPSFNFEKNKAFKITMKGASDFAKADLVSRQMEKMQLAIFSVVDPQTSTGFFIVDNINKVQGIEKALNNLNGFSFVAFEEVSLTEDLFLEMYLKRGGFEKADYSKNKPKQIMMGPDVNLTNSLYRKAIDLWEKDYSKAYQNNLNGRPEHYPVFVSTGNPEKDSYSFELAKQEWIKNYPKEAESYSGIPYQGEKAK